MLSLMTEVGFVTVHECDTVVLDDAAAQEKGLPSASRSGEFYSLMSNLSFAITFGRLILHCYLIISDLSGL